MISNSGQKNNRVVPMEVVMEKYEKAIVDARIGSSLADQRRGTVPERRKTLQQNWHTRIRSSIP